MHCFTSRSVSVELSKDIAGGNPRYCGVTYLACLLSLVALFWTNACPVFFKLEMQAHGCFKQECHKISRNQNEKD
jgi:hypothetical protein